MKPIQWKAITILAGGATQEKTAAECGVCAFTIRRWLKRPEFQDAIQKELPKMIAATRAAMCPRPVPKIPHKTTHYFSTRALASVNERFPHISAPAPPQKF